MSTLRVELPLDLVSIAELDQGSGLSCETAKLIALQLFREDKISLGRAAELCQTPIEAFMEYAGRHGVPIH
jgi:predicted HTH domain antitoxin